MPNKFLYSLILTSMLVSCSTYRKITYLQRVDQKGIDTVFKSTSPTYKLQVADILYIGVSSLDENAARPFNNNIASSVGSQSLSNPYLMGYSIEKDGFIDMPVLGKIRAAGFTTDEIKETVLREVSKYLKDAVVDVKLLSFKISVIGEVKSPGMRTISNEKANIFEVIALSGDLTYNGNHKNVMILRQTDQGTKVMRVDLTDRNLLSSENFNLHPNDIVYVEPVKMIGFRIAASDFAVLISVITATVTTVLIVQKL